MSSRVTNPDLRRLVERAPAHWSRAPRSHRTQVVDEFLEAPQICEVVTGELQALALALQDAGLNSCSELWGTFTRNDVRRQVQWLALEDPSNGAELRLQVELEVFMAVHNYAHAYMFAHLHRPSARPGGDPGLTLARMELMSMPPSRSAESGRDLTAVMLRDFHHWRDTRWFSLEETARRFGTMAASGLEP